jgi:hypothetical protein
LAMPPASRYHPSCWWSLGRHLVIGMQCCSTALFCWGYVQTLRWSYLMFPIQYCFLVDYLIEVKENLISCLLVTCLLHLTDVSSRTCEVL